mgnify:CR=1 FL=1
MQAFRSTLFVLAALLVILTWSSTSDGTNPTNTLFAEAAKKKGGKNKKKAVKKYNEVTELMSDMARSICESLGKLVKRKKFDHKRRCDLYAEVVEDLGSMTDAMVKEMDQTQQEMVDTAMKFPHYSNLQMNLKKVAKMVLERRQPSEKIIQEELTKDMSQWILNVASRPAAAAVVALAWRTCHVRRSRTFVPRGSISPVVVAWMLMPARRRTTCWMDLIRRGLRARISAATTTTMRMTTMTMMTTRSILFKELVRT